MKRIILLAVLAATTHVSAQSWSPDEQAIIDRVKRCNDGWVESIRDKRFEKFTSVCPETRDAVFWYPGSAAPARYAGSDGVWSRFSSSLRAVTWADMRPVTVQVDGDLALIYYAVTWIPVPATGEPVRRPSHRLNVFRRVNGRWLMAGGTVAAAN